MYSSQEDQKLEMDEWERCDHSVLSFSTANSPSAAERGSPQSTTEPESEPARDEEQVPESTGRSTLLILQVGERRFTTTFATLTSESGFFSSMLSNNWRDNNSKQPDGSYFVDADPGLFAHVLRYLRHGQLPIFYGNRDGHDYGMYAALLAEARYFQIDRLVQWLEKKKYLEAVKIERIPEQAEEVSALRETTLATEDVECHPFQKTKKVYICPRQIWTHRGNPRACGKMCAKARGDDEAEFEDEIVVKTLVVRKRVVFNHDLCFEG
jgi:BTB/POZ domain-containing protein KCTD9